MHSPHWRSLPVALLVACSSQIDSNPSGEQPSNFGRGSGGGQIDGIRA